GSDERRIRSELRGTGGPPVDDEQLRGGGYGRQRRRRLQGGLRRGTHRRTHGRSARRTRKATGMKRIGSPPALPKRGDAAHKGTFGHAFVVAGSRGMSGAAVLCGLSALRGGAGLVTVAIPEPIADVVAS